MDKSKMMKRLMETFLEELEEHVRAFNQDLLILEKGPPAEEWAERFKTLFRTAHSLKGAARSVNVPLIEGACHRLEEILERVRDGKLPLTPERIALLFSAVDAMEEAGMRLREQQDISDAPLADLLPRLDAALAENPPLSTRSEAPPTKSSPPEPGTSAEAPQSAASSRPSAGDAHPESALSSGSVRVSAEKLDVLLANVGEVMVAQRRMQTRLSEVAELQEFVSHWKNEWKGAERYFAREKPAEPNAGGRMEPAMPRRAASTLRQTGEHLRRLEKSLERLATTMAKDARLLEQLTRPLDDEVHRVRMLPFSDACAGLDRMVRDLAQGDGKEVELVIRGGDVELDRSILEGLKDPLRHLIRNAVGHGLEPTAERRLAGKRAQGRLVVGAALRGTQVEVVVEEDGRGLDLESIRAQIRRKKLTEPADDRELIQFIFQPGFSTAAIVTDVSGRGVGLDVVKNRVEALHGTIEISSHSGAGTRFTLKVPLTLTTLRVVLVQAGEQTYAFAGTNVLKLVHVKPDEIRTIAGREVLPFAGGPLPLASLRQVLQVKAATKEARPAKIPVLIVVAGTTRMAFMVDRLVAEQEVLIKNLGVRIRQIPLVAGATQLASGRLALVLNAATLIRTAFKGPTMPLLDSEPAQSAIESRRKLLVVEDSMTTRILMKSILEAAGYDVAVAVDGKAGWDYLQDHPVELVVSDVDMPNMTGFELTEALRESAKFRDLPLVLVTARENEADKARGIAVGAQGYLVKSAFDQRNLLETIGQLL